MEIPTTLKDLAEILQLRKRLSNPYNLLLTSTISLTPQVLYTISGTSDWYEFCSWIKRKGIEDRKNILKHYLSKTDAPAGYDALAKLLKNGYFSTVLTTNLDSRLDDALFDCGLRSTNYETLVVNRDKNEHIAAVLDSEPRGIRIIKLRGSLSDGEIPDTFPELFDIDRDLRSSLERYINRDLVIVGSIEREDDLRRSLAYQGGRIYYAIPDQPIANDDVVKAIRARGIELQAALISGPYGYFEELFKALESLLLPATSATSDVKAPKKEQQPHTPQASTQIAEKSSIVAKVPPLSQESRSSPSPPDHAQATSPDPTLQEKSHKALLASNMQEKVDSHNTNAAVESRESSPSTRKEKQGVSVVSLVRVIAIALIVLAGIGAIFFMVSLFSRNTPSFTSGAIVILLIIAAAILLGIARIIDSEQITRVFTFGINSANGNPIKGGDDNAKKTMNGKDKDKEKE